MKEPQKRAFTRIKELDILRGVAAMEVMFSHYTGSYDYQHGLKNSLGFSVTDGNYGVFLFFAISGFVILLTLQNCVTSLDFVISRFSRIFPAYWVAILLTSATLAWLAPPGPSILRILANFTMLDKFMGFQHIDLVYWTLNVELSFYCWMLLCFKLRLLPRLNLVMAGALFFQLCASLLQRYTGHAFSQGIKVIFLTEYVQLFCCGMLFLAAREKGWNKTSLGLLCWCVVNQALVPYRPFPWVPNPAWGTLIILIVIFIMSLVIYGKLKWTVTAPTLFLGTISYTFYLVHAQIGFAIMGRLVDAGFSRWAGFIIALSAAILFATAITFLVEKPAMKWIRKMYSNWKQRHHERPYKEVSPQSII